MPVRDDEEDQDEAVLADVAAEAGGDSLDGEGFDSVDPSFGVWRMVFALPTKKTRMSNLAAACTDYYRQGWPVLAATPGDSVNTAAPKGWARPLMVLAAMLSMDPSTN